MFCLVAPSQRGDEEEEGGGGIPESPVREHQVCIYKREKHVGECETGRTAFSWEVGPLLASLALRSRFCCALAPFPMLTERQRCVECWLWVYLVALCCICRGTVIQWREEEEVE